jgi:hypothetical protein
MFILPIHNRTSQPRINSPLLLSYELVRACLSHASSLHRDRAGVPQNAAMAPDTPPSQEAPDGTTSTNMPSIGHAGSLAEGRRPSAQSRAAALTEATVLYAPMRVEAGGLAMAWDSSSLIREISRSIDPSCMPAGGDSQPRRTVLPLFMCPCRRSCGPC